MSRAVALIAVLVFALLAVGGLSAQYQSTVEDTQPQQVVENESFTIHEGTTHVFNGSHQDVVYNDSADVYQSGTEYEEEGNYTWNMGNGTLFVPADSSFTNNSSAAITYRYHEPSDAQRITRDIALQPLQLGEGLGIIVGAALLLTAVALLGRQR